MHSTPPEPPQEQSETYEPPAIISRQPIREPVIASVVRGGSVSCMVATP